MAKLNHLSGKIQRVNHLNRTDSQMMRVYWSRERKGIYGPAWVRYEQKQEAIAFWETHKP